MWTNNQHIRHTIISNTGLFSSPSLGKDQQFSNTFNTPGTYDYSCGNHPSMTGSIIVTGGAVLNATITGTATNATSGETIAGATVTAGGINAITNPGGIYNMSIAPGTYSVTASASGYISNITSVTVPSGGTVNQDFALRPRAVGGGDVNPIPGLDVGDVLFTAQFVAGVRTPTAAQMAACDVNPIPGVDVGDVLFVAQAVAGLRIL
jgi:hypothetical protein